MAMSRVVFGSVDRWVATGLLAMAGLGVVVQPAAAQTVNWTGAGANGNWQNTANWSTGTVPTSANSVRIDNPTQTAVVRTSTGTQSVFSLYMGYLAGSGSLRIIDAGVLNANILDVSTSRAATISVESGGTFNTNLSTVGSGALGTVTVTGSGSTWTNANGFDGFAPAFVIGDYDGTGVVNVQNRGTLRVNGTAGVGTGTIVLAGDIFGPTDSSGTLNIGTGGVAGFIEAGTIRGAGTNATVNFNHTNANYQFGTLITGTTKVNLLGTGRTVFTGAHTYTGGTTVQNGELMLDGGSITHTAADLNISATGGATATTTVRNGGSISVRNTLIGDAAGTSGAGVIRSGTWTNAGDLTVGNYGTGTLDILGGTVTQVGGRVGRYAGSTGTVTVGSGGRWTGTTGIAIGGEGSGTLNLQAGGTVDGGALSVGAGGSTTGSAGIGVVNMTGGTISLTGAVAVGLYGQGTFNLTDGSVTSGDISVGNFSTATGTITMDAGTWSGRVFRVGANGEGTLNLNGGTLTTTDAYIGSEETGAGTVTMTGGTWNANSLNVGYKGTAEMTVSDGLVNVTEGVYLATFADSTGDLTVSGTGSGVRGVVAAKFISAGDGEATVVFDGGIVRAKEDQAEFFQGFDLGGVNLTGEGLLVDTDGFDIGFTNVLAGNGELTKRDAGALTLSAANTYTGGTTLRNGSLVIGNNAAFGTGAVTVRGGTLATDGGSFYAIENDFVLRSDFSVKVDTSVDPSAELELEGDVDLGNAVRRLDLSGDLGTLCFGGVISGAGGLNFQTAESGFAVMFCGAADNTYTGLTTVGNNVGMILGVAGTASAGDFLIQTGGFVGAEIDDQFAAGATVTVDGDLNFYFSEQQTVNELLGTGSVTSGVVSDAALTVNKGNFSGVLQDSVSVLSLKKETAGTLTLSGANTYAGGTTINAGTLVAAASGGRALGTGAVTLGSLGTLELASGTGLSIKALDWANGGTFVFDLGSGSQVFIDETLTQTGTGAFALTNASLNVAYDLITYENVGSTTGAWTANAVSSITGTFGVRDNLDGTSTLYVIYAGTSTGPVINNDAPDYTPTNADFQVAGNVTAVAGVQQVGSLTFADGGILSITDFLAVNSGLFNVPTGTGIIRDGVLITPGNFTKIGTGLLNIFSVIAVGGNTYVQTGTLAVNGSLNTDELFVQAGAFLKGAGIINGNVVNNGTVAPGNSPGTLTVNGNFTQNSGGALQIEVADAAFDQLIVTGRATLAGTLQAIAFGGHKFAYGDRVPFLQAGSISGEFDQIVMPKNYRGRFLVNGGTGTLLVAPSSYALVAENQNQENVAKALDSFIGTSGDKDTVSTALDIQTENEYGNAFDQISPGFYQSLTDMVIEQTNAQNQMLAQRLSAVRLGVGGFSVVGLDQAALANDRDGKNVMDARSGKDIISPTTETDWSVFVQGNGIFARVTNVSQVPNYNFNSGGFIVGADYTFGGKTSVTRGEGKKAVVETSEGSSLTLGLYGGYQGTYAKYGNNGRMTINSAVFGTYASFANGGFYSDLIVGGSYNGYRASRPIDFSTVDRTARSSPDGGTVSAYLDAGYDFHAGNFTFGPILSGQYVYAGSSAFTESGADSLDLRVSQQNANSLRTNIGGRVAYTWQLTDSITIVPEGRMFWQHEYLNGTRDIGASLDGGSGPSFDFNTSDPGRDSVFAGAGVSANFGDRWSTSFYYNADFGRQDFVSHMISANLGWKF